MKCRIIFSNGYFAQIHKNEKVHQVKFEKATIFENMRIAADIIESNSFFNGLHEGGWDSNIYMLPVWEKLK